MSDSNPALAELLLQEGVPHSARCGGNVRLLTLLSLLIGLVLAVLLGLVPCTHDGVGQQDLATSMASALPAEPVFVLPFVATFDTEDLAMDGQGAINKVVGEVGEILNAVDGVEINMHSPQQAAVQGRRLAQKDQKSNFWADLALGGVSGGIVKTAMSPIERVKILMQTQDSNPKIISGEMARYTGMADCFKRVAAEQGVAAFWRGNLVNCIRYAPQQGSALAFNDAIKRAFPKFNPKTQYWQDFGAKLLAGGCAGGLANVACYPFDYARTRLASDVQAGKGQFNGIADCIKKTIQQGGVTGLYRGSAVTVAGAFVYRGGQLGLFGQIMDMNPYKEDKGAMGVLAAFTCATVARSVTTPFNYPFDTVRRRMMLDSEKPAAERLYTSGINCFGKVMKNEGFKGMYKGLGPEMIRGIGGPLVLTAYDRIKLWMYACDE